jgi:VWFA-related protein
MEKLSLHAAREAVVPTLLGFGFLLTSLFPGAASAQAQAPAQNPPTFTATSRLVFLDVTVLDRKGHVVVSGLTKDDFTITENRKRQPIFSFEKPASHHVQGSSTRAGKIQTPATVLVLDLLNSRFEDFAYIRYEVRKYLEAQPAMLDSPAELMVLGNLSLELGQSFTRSRADLLDALARVPAALPWKEMNGAFWAERFGQSIDALQQIALQNQGMPGRKNIIWVGQGSPGLFTEELPPSLTQKLNQYVHDTTNLLVDARVSLFVIYPGLKVNSRTLSMSEITSGVDLGDSDPFSGDINFGVFVNETGGRLFFNRNDIDHEIARSQELGSEYYTLTYRPPPGDANGNFRRVRVAVRNPDLHVLTKSGYFAPTPAQDADPRQKQMANIAEAVQSTIAFPALALKIDGMTKHTDTGRIEFNVVLKGKGLSWQSASDGNSIVHLMAAAASMAKSNRVLASKLDTLDVKMDTQDPKRLADSSTRIPMNVRLPAQTNFMRVVVENPDNGRLGAVIVDRKAIDAAPDVATPPPNGKTLPPATAQ